MKMLHAALAVGAVFIVATSSPSVRAASPDAHWIRTAVSANMLEIKSGKLAEMRSQTSDWRSFGAMMVRDHSKALAGLCTLAMDKSVALPKGLLPADETAYAQLSRAHGSNFEREYGEFAVNSHVQANALYTKEISFGRDSDVRAVAAKQLPTVQNHLEMADKMAGKGIGNMR
jgi:putative membrane protein